MAFNTNTTDDINNKLKFNFELNKKKPHQNQLLIAICELKLFLYFDNYLWELNMDSDTKSHKTIKIFIFSATVTN